MIAKTEAEIAILRECGKRLAAVLRELAAVVEPGVTTAELDTLAGRLIASAGGSPVFKGYQTHHSDPPYPASICTSVNSEVVHGIPRRDRVLVEGDIIGIDIGMRYPRDGGFITDTALTVPVGKISDEAERLLQATRSALGAGTAMLRAGIQMGDLGATIQDVIEQKGFSVIRELVGHGVGGKLHEDPYVPNYGTRGRGMKIPIGMVLAIEPMASAGASDVILDRDGWTWKTKDGSLAAHFEHTVLTTKDGAEILTKVSTAR